MKIAYRYKLKRKNAEKIMKKQEGMKMKKRMIWLFIIGLTLAVSGRALAASFTFKIPTIPFTPILSDVSNASAVVGQPSFTVYASISGDLQQKACCGAACDRTDCDMGDWYMLTDTTISPNPTCIPNANGQTDMPDASCKIPGLANPIVYYYKDPDVDQAEQVSMAFDSETGKFKADIPIDSSWVTGDVIKYFIAASDNRGNVISMLPEKSTAPCASLTTWITKYETPPVDNCSVANSYEKCSNNYSGQPSCAGSADSTVNDPEGDTCGEPNSAGVQSIVANSENTDILGYSLGAGLGYSALPNDTVVCGKMVLKGSTPTASSGPIEGYLLMFFNPDITDPNPADIYFPNVFAVTYAPEAAGADKNLVSVLWDGECVSNPNTSDILGCKIVVGNEGESKFKVGLGTNSHNLIMIAKNAVTTKTGNKTIIGDKSSRLRTLTLTGEINLSGGTAFWVVDLTAGIMMVKETMETTLGNAGKPAAPLYKSIACQANGSGDDPACTKSTTKPANNQCVITINPSPDAFAEKYMIYHNTTNDSSTATHLTDLDITTDLRTAHTVSYTVPQASLDGTTHYFFFSASTAASGETDRSKWTASEGCRVEDWKAPDPPTSAACSTPDGSQKKCLCTWSGPAGDTTLYGYNIKRSGSQLNGLTILGEQYTDSDETLVNGSTYSYEIQAIDVGNNESTWTSTSCVPEDLKPPSKVDTLGITLQLSKAAIDSSWAVVSDEDVEKYNFYGCYQDPTKPGSCNVKTGTTSINGYTLYNTQNQPTSANTLYYSKDDGFGEAETWCFYVEACDNCKTAGTCPNKVGTDSNCSAFDTISTYMKCLTITATSYDYAPFWPTNQTSGDEMTTTPLTEGNSCKLEWNKICEGDDGTFVDCNFPTAFELLGYKVMRAAATNNDCSITTVNDPGSGTPIATVGISSSPSYTDSTGLTNNTKYCYRVYGYNAFGKYSRKDPIPTPVACTPVDTKAPDKPEIDADNSEYSTEDGACNIKWAAVEDKGAISYSAYRCQGDLTTCNSATKFTNDELTDATDFDTAEFADPSVSTSVEAYTYCITAKDASGNTSTKYESADTTNCYVCYTGAQPCKTPGTVSAYEYNSQHGVKATWLASTSDDSSYDSGEGYNVYLCTSPTTCATKLNGSTPVQSFGTDYIKSDAGVSATCTDCYVGVSYVHMPTCKESDKTISSMPSSTSGKITVEPNVTTYCTTNPDSCPTTLKPTGGGTGGEIRIASYTDPQCASTTDCMKTPITPTYTNLAGATVELVDDAAPSTIISIGTVGDDGIVPGMAAPTGQTGHTYTVRLKLPLDTYSVGCASKTADSCYMTLKTGLTLPTTASTVTAKGTDVASPDTGNGGDIGNPNCDKDVNLTDILLIKNAYGAAAGDACYRAWADFNSDGNINLTDIIYMKKFYGQTISSSTISGAVLCQSKAPLPSCCATKSCTN